MDDEDDIQGLPRLSFKALDTMQTAADQHRQVWQRVVRRLIQDAFGNTGHSDPNDHDRAMRQSRMWFRFSPEDVEMVFDLAEVENWREIRREVIDHEPSYRRDEDPKS